MTIKASVIIPTKNAGSLFKKVLDAVLTQKVPWQFEVLVIDSGSTDGTVEYVRARNDVMLHQIPPETFGHGKTRNLGVSLTCGEFVVMLTHDALPADDSWLFELVSAVEQADNVAGAFGRHIAYAQDGPFLARDLKLHFDGFLQWPSVVSMDDEARYQVDAGYRQVLHFFSDNNACLRRSVWEKIPYPDVDFAEDQLWAKQVIEAGYAKAYADKAVVYHSHHFGVVETLRRSFDESRALKRLFGYALCPTVAHLLLQAFKMTLQDVAYLKNENRMVSEVDWMIRAPFLNLAKQCGFYLGQRHERLPDGLVRFVSRDMALQRQ